MIIDLTQSTPSGTSPLLTFLVFWVYYSCETLQQNINNSSSEVCVIKKAAQELDLMRFFNY
jgi:hypothetical protein